MRDLRLIWEGSGESESFTRSHFAHGQNRRKRDSPPQLLIRMSQLCRKVVQLRLRRRLRRRMLILRRWFRRLFDRLLMCSLGKRIRYRMLPTATAVASPSLGDSPEVVGFKPEEHVTQACHNLDVDTSDLVALKISLLGDSQSGKTSFLVCIFYVCMYVCMHWSLGCSSIYCTWCHPS